MMATVERNQIEWTQDQLAAVDAILSGLANPDQRFLTLEGYAGTGKTTVLNHILQTMRQRGDHRTVVACAYTNKAVGVIAKMAREFGLNIPCVTVCQLLGLKPKVINQDTGEVKFIPEHGQTPKFNDYQLVIIDECSMIGSELFEHIYNAVIESDMFHRTKVLFVGDSAQLPPVGERTSPTFDAPGAVKGSLTEVVRYSGSIAVLAEDVRTNNRRVKFPRITTDHSEDRQQGIWYYTDKGKWERQLIRAFTSDNAKSDPDYVRALAYTNKRVLSLNEKIKTAIYGDDCPRFFSGQNLIAQDPIMHGDMIKIPTSAEFVLDYAVQDEIRCCGEFWQGWKLETRFNGEPVSLRVLSAEAESQFRREAAKFAKDKRWKEFWNLKQFWHNVRDIHALTVHKSQGSTFQNVFLDMHDLKTCKSAADRNALLYVALTRTAKRLFILGE